MTYEIEITRFAPEPTTERFTVATPEAAAQRVQIDGTIQLVVFVAALERERGLDLGNFYLSCNAERAVVELQEHRSHFATDPQLIPTDESAVSFKNEQGSGFSVPYWQTLAPQQALAALLFWLPGQKHTPALKWS